MTDTITFAVEHLYDTVAARFEAEGTVVAMTFGWREPPRQQTTPRRIVWTPGDEKGAIGDIAPARKTEEWTNPRPLLNLKELFTVTISANDSSKPENERAQYAATRALYDAWVRAVALAVGGAYTLKSQTWIVDRANERRLGAAIRVVGVLEAVIPDAAYATAPVDTKAEIDVEELDVTETVTTEDPP